MSRAKSFVLVAVCCAGLLAVSGCGSRGIAGAGGSQPGTPVKGENTTVTVVLTSTANDQLMEYVAFLKSLTLTSQSGTQVSLLPAEQQVEFMGLNGEAEPLVTLSVPQDVYTSASATIGYSQFVCVSYNAHDNVVSSSYADEKTPDTDVTVDLPAKLTVAGQSLGLLLNLDVGKSASWSSPPCGSATTGSYSITPTFDLTSFGISREPTAPWNGKMTGLRGFVTTAPNGSGMFGVTSADGPKGDPFGTTVTSGVVWNVSVDSSTAFQGVQSIASVTQGMAVDVDGDFQPDGSILASRVDVVDADTSTPSLSIGPLDEVISFEPVLSQFNRQNEGALLGDHLNLSPGIAYGYSSADFEISPAFANLRSLPFSASFNSQNMVAGQNTMITSHATTTTNSTPAKTVMLIPQTIDGTVKAVNTVGGFTAYTVTLASYDSFPTLAFTNSYQTSPLTDPGTVTVYADAETSVLSSEAPAAGGAFRFYGLIFNDGGALKMDCSQISDGVTE